MSQPNSTKTHDGRRLLEVSGPLLHHHQGRDRIQVAYEYDDADQLTSLTYQKASTTLGNLTYTYDSGGRRIGIGGSFAQVNLPTAVSSSAHDAANRVTTWGSHTLDYDEKGALVSDVGPTMFTYVWDERHRLKEIKQGAITMASFQYDAFNRRTGRTMGGVSKTFLNDGLQVVQELTGTTPTANLLTGLQLDQVFRRTVGSTVEDLLSDALGTTIAIADGAGTIQTIYGYESYGATTPNGSGSSNAYQYTGRENDGAVYYYRNRYYSTALNRFITEDPIGLAGGANVYAYVRGNPISYIDPMGLEPTAACDTFADGWRKSTCEFCVKAFCQFGVQSLACCAIDRDECLGKNAGDDQEMQKCNAKYADCAVKKRKGGPKLPKPPEDI